MCKKDKNDNYDRYSNSLNNFCCPSAEYCSAFQINSVSSASWLNVDFWVDDIQESAVFLNDFHLKYIRLEQTTNGANIYEQTTNGAK